MAVVIFGSHLPKWYEYLQNSCISYCNLDYAITNSPSCSLKGLWLCHMMPRLNCPWIHELFCYKPSATTEASLSSVVSFQGLQPCHSVLSLSFSSLLPFSFIASVTWVTHRHYQLLLPESYPPSAHSGPQILCADHEEIVISLFPFLPVYNPPIFYKFMTSFCH